MKYADFKNDDALYSLLTNENKNITNSFFNAFVNLENRNKIVRSVTSRSFYHLVNAKGANRSYMTINAFDNEDNKIYIEFHLLSLHYGMDSIVIENTTEFNHKFLNENTALKYPVYFIFFTTFEITNINQYLQQNSYKQKYSDHNIEVIIVDLTKFNKTPQQLTTEQEYWIYAFKHNIEHLQHCENFTVLKELLQFADFSTWDEHSVNEYADAEKRYNKVLLRVLEIHKERNVLPEDYPAEIKENKAEFHTFLIPKSLGIYPYGDFKTDRIDISGANEVINKVAFTLFREWRKSYMEAENITEFNIADEQPLIAVTKKCLKQAIYSFFTDEDYLIKGMTGDYYFTINLKLAIKLEYEFYKLFISRQSDDYKTFTALMQINSYFNDEITRKLQINTDYKNAMQSNVNIEKFDLHISDTEERRKALMQYEGFDKDNDYIRAILEKLIFDYILKIIGGKDMSYIKNYKSTIPDEYVDKLLQANEYLFKTDSNETK